MSRKVYYRYNLQTGSYERVYPSKRERLMATLGHIGLSILLGGGVFLLLNGLIDLPKERMLRSENKQLQEQLMYLENRLERAQSVITDLADRDNNFYRVMMQADRITDSRRFAGMERQRVGKLNDNLLVSELSRHMDLLEREIVVQSKSYDELRLLARNRADRLAHTPAIQPVSELDLKQMASGYGRRVDPIYGTVRMHEGMDFACDIGTPVYATADGVVKAAEWHSGYGNKVDIDHGYGYMTRYAHLSEYKVRPGQSVKRGDLIALAGNTGKSTGPHVHYEVRLKGVPQNPINYYFYDITPDEYAELIKLAENAGHVMD